MIGTDTCVGSKVLESVCVVGIHDILSIVSHHHTCTCMALICAKTFETEVRGLLLKYFLILLHKLMDTVISTMTLQYTCNYPEEQANSLCLLS